MNVRNEIIVNRNKITETRSLTSRLALQLSESITQSVASKTGIIHQTVNVLRKNIFKLEKDLGDMSQSVAQLRIKVNTWSQKNG